MIDLAKKLVSPQLKVVAGGLVKFQIWLGNKVPCRLDKAGHIVDQDRLLAESGFSFHKA